MELKQVREACADAAARVCDGAKLRAGDLFVVGCSSSEILGEKIGTHSSVETAGAVFEGIWEVLRGRDIYLAAQCCEHLNRALVVERAAYERFGLEQVNVVPQPKAGGSFATTAYARFADPVAVESLRQSAHAGMDIGGTLIGMHIHPVVVPLRIGVSRIGEATLICARRRCKFVGGSRAVYDENLL
ncbi:TIGR01440 family protein [Agathobaculum sp.]|uniref:TIGR01440 family protein n=1 Tax=Agathobaculum sp. TaxID=2048138 RepID=UPI002A8126F1|nr:TIGR01440 family protein [Agathobaculum sp.]MDY3619122.1 TIGR01440 family protein [Agathobaculum sp.]